MNITIPSVTPCINIVGDTWVFVLGVFIGFALSFVTVFSGWLWSIR